MIAAIDARTSTKENGADADVHRGAVRPADNEGRIES